MKAREEEKEDAAEVDVNAENLPESPSPKKPSTATVSRTEGLIPKFKWPRGAQALERRSPPTDSDRLGERHASFEEHKSNDSMDPANLSIGNSEVSLTGLDRSEIYHSADQIPEESILQDSSFLQDESQHEDSRSLAMDLSYDVVEHSIPNDTTREPPKPSPRSDNPSRATSPTLHSESPSLTMSHSSGSSRTLSPHPVIRHRISKENIRRRFTERRSPLSPSPEPNVQDPESFIERAEVPPVLHMDQEETEPQLENTAIPRYTETHLRNDLDRERDRLSIMTALTDISTEPATIQHAEKLNVTAGLPSPAPDKEFGMLNGGSNLQLNFGSKFSLGGLGLRRGDGDTGSTNDPEVPSSDEENRSIASGTVKMGNVDVNMDMKSALDRLMDDVAGGGGEGDGGDDSMMTDEYEESYEQPMEPSRPRGVQRAATDSVLQTGDASGRILSGSSHSSIPPPVPPKDNIKAREQLILEKRREARRAEEGGFMPTKGRGQRLQVQLGIGRPTRRRSMSTGDVQGLADQQALNLGDVERFVEDDPLSDSIERELKKLGRNGTTKKIKYQIREHEGTIYASASEDKISHMAAAGDVDTGKAWRTVRRPSDMNEYSKQIKEYRAQASPGKAYGKIFVKVLGIMGVYLPLPHEPTALTCTLNNGIHFVTTPECQLGPDCRIEQEFELIEHSKLEFTLTLKIRRDPHIVAQYKALVPAPTPAPLPPPVVQQASSRGMRAFFSSSPKKASKEKVTQPPPPAAHRLPENLARYLKPDGTLARAFVQFKDIAGRCDTRLFETSYPLIGQRVELGGKFSTLQVGEIVLQMFRLPPLPGIPPDQLPQSLEECHRGLRHINWHKMTYFQGTLTQSGGDCNTWRRRHFRVIGANLVAFNDVTKKATATIDLKKALAVQDDQDLRDPLSPLALSKGYEDGLFGVERSFRLLFPAEQEIIFFADTDEEKARWLDVLRALVGHIPPHPLWAELLWQRQEEISKRSPSSSNSSGLTNQNTAVQGP